MYLLARAQALSGRPHDALIMLQRLAEMGVASDAATNDDFVRTRQLPGWPDLLARIEGLSHPASRPPASSSTAIRGPDPGPADPGPDPGTDPGTIHQPIANHITLAANAGRLPVLDPGFYARRTRVRRGVAPIPFRRSARAQADGGGRRDEPYRGLRPRRLRGIWRHRGDGDRRQAWRSLGDERRAR